MPSAVVPASRCVHPVPPAEPSPNEWLLHQPLPWHNLVRLAEDVARPVVYHNRSGTCWHPYVKGYTAMVNSIYNGNRMEDVWLDK